jgi:hypothetical protein
MLSYIQEKGLRADIFTFMSILYACITTKSSAMVRSCVRTICKDIILIPFVLKVPEVLAKMAESGITPDDRGGSCVSLILDVISL